MPCCPSDTFSFAGVANTIISYTPAMVAAFGPQPRVEVYYYDTVAKEFYNNNGSPVGTVEFSGGNIKIDHGGVASGFVKVS